MEITQNRIESVHFHHFRCDFEGSNADRRAHTVSSITLYMYISGSRERDRKATLVVRHNLWWSHSVAGLYLVYSKLV